MVRSKISTYLLGLAAVAVWCIVGYRIFRWISPKETPLARAVTTKTEIVNQAEDSLMLDYRDPFLGDVREPRVSDYHDSPAPEPVMPSLAYKGLIRDGNGIIKAMIYHEGRLDGYSKGAVIGGVRLTEITAEYIIVKWRGTDYTITAK